ncbi:hypothetical protein Q9233_000546 [Columba guinea]|nr:hypothetical protein Q9233_000546 [Columba guinea]
MDIFLTRSTFLVLQQLPGFAGGTKSKYAASAAGGGSAEGAAHQREEGAAIDTRRTSQTYGCQGNWICGVIQLFRAANPPEAVLQGLDADGEEETLLGMFMYNVAKEPIQTFPLKALPRAFSYIKFLVKSNWGNPKYTCIYRVRVHGKMAKPESLS